jgi:hypothetical protein
VTAAAVAAAAATPAAAAAAAAAHMSVCAQTTDSTKVRRILQMVIAMGNFLNEGTKQV